jgi:hypothetical protein
MREVEEEGGSNGFVGEGTGSDYLEQLEQIASANQFGDELK